MSARDKQSLSRASWIAAARAALLAGGVDAVKVFRLARALGATRGSFYWHFENRDELLDALLAEWERTNTEPFERVLSDDRSGLEEFQAVVDLWLSEREFDPALDTAVRDWGRTSKRVAGAVRRADAKRIAVLRRIFLDLGDRDPEALVRARIVYFHQVGYYALGLGESAARRRELAPVYVRALLGEHAPGGKRRAKRSAR